MTAPRILLKNYQLTAKKQLGQNFLTDMAMARKIVALADIDADDAVVEIGAGLGMLTIAIGRVARRVWAIETDGRLLDLLRSELTLADLPEVAVVGEDFFNLELGRFRAVAGGPVVVMGNLPYHLSSQILVSLIHQRAAVTRAVLMFQKEMAERLVAPPGTKTYGRLSAILGYCARVTTLTDLPAKRFFPPPKIDSRVVEVHFRTRPAAVAHSESFLFDTVKAAFAQRRKTLKNALSGSFLNPTPAAVRTALDAARIDPRRRAETLSPKEFVYLSNALYTALATDGKDGHVTPIAEGKGDTNSAEGLS